MYVRVVGDWSLCEVVEKYEELSREASFGVMKYAEKGGLYQHVVRGSSQAKCGGNDSLRFRHQKG